MLSPRILVPAALLCLCAGVAVAQPETKPDAKPGERQPPERRQRPAPIEVKIPAFTVPADAKTKGTVYYCLAGMERQATFHSDTPVEQIDGYSSTVVGYAVAGPKDAPAKLAAGEWHMPVTSVDTGNGMRNGHMASEGWLDAAKHPEIVFKLKEVKDIQNAPSPSPGVTAYACTLVGDMTIHGVTKPMSIASAKVSFLPQSAESAKIAQGDLMMVNCKFSLKLSDFEVQNKVIGQKVAENVDLTVALVHSTVKPEPSAAKPMEGHKGDKAEKADKDIHGS